MTARDAEDGDWNMLERLPVLEPDAMRASKTRQHCRALLERRHHRRERTRAASTALRLAVQPVSVAAFCAFCVVYVGALVATAFFLRTPQG